MIRLLKLKKEPKALSIISSEFLQQLFYLSEFFWLVHGECDIILKENSTAD